VRYVWQQNRGMAGARNTGIREARGEFISFLDDDDLWEPDHLSQALEALHGMPEASACHTGWQIIDSAGVRLPQMSTRTVPPEQLRDSLLDGGFFPPCSVTVRRYCFERLGVFDENLQGYADWDMWIRVSEVYPFLGIPRVSALYRVHGGGLSSNIDHMFTDSLKAVGKHFGPQEGDPATWPIERRRAYAMAYLTAALAYFQRNDLDHGRSDLATAFRLYPPTAERVDVFYELACGDQPRGWRGDFATHSMENNQKSLLDSLAYVFDSERATGEVKAVRDLAYANAYLALGLLAYGAGELGKSRSMMLRAVSYRPSLALDPQVSTRVAKSFLGAELLGTLKRARARDDGVSD
jgi:glycosyltransferase involved in cell wall biosynthesis